jgi:hypothetical protein
MIAVPRSESSVTTGFDVGTGLPPHGPAAVLCADCREPAPSDRTGAEACRDRVVLLANLRTAGRC